MIRLLKRCLFQVNMNLTFKIPPYSKNSEDFTNFLLKSLMFKNIC